MFLKARLWPWNEPMRTEDRPASRTSYQTESTAIATSTEESSGQSSSRSAYPVEICCPDDVQCVAFLGDGENVVSGDNGGKIRRWRVDYGSEVGVPMNAGSGVCSIAVSGGWIVCGTSSGSVQLWNAKTHDKEREIPGHRGWRYVVTAVDVSPDAARIASGSNDKTACVWSLSTGARLLGPWKHDGWVAATKFSSDGRLVATATLGCDSVRVYDERGLRLFDVAIRVGSGLNNSLAWSPDGNHLFALSHDGDIHSLAATTGKTLVKWTIHDTEDARCIAVANNGTFVAASAASSVSLWDMTTRQQIGSVVQFSYPVYSLVISDNHDLATHGYDTQVVSIHNVGDMLPQSCRQDAVIKRPRRELADARHTAEEQIKLLRDENVQLKETIEKLHRHLAQSRRVVDEQKGQIESWQMKANGEIAQLKQTNEKLNRDLTKSQRLVDEHKEQTDSWKMKANDEITQLGQSNDKLRSDLAVSSSQISENQERNEKLMQANQELQSVIRVHEQKYEFEALYTQGRTVDAAKKLLEIGSRAGEHIKSDEFLSGWLTDSMSRCTQILEKTGQDASNAGKHEEAVIAYAAALSLGSSNPSAVLAEWASTVLTNREAREALQASVQFKASRFAVYHAVCNVLEEIGRISEAVEAFRQMLNDLRDTDTSDERTRWERDFQERCVEKLVNLADAARDDKKHEAAIQHYSLAISLDSTNLNDVLLKRGNELIKLDQSSFKGYEEKHRALHGMGRYSAAFEAFKEMLSIFERSRDPEIRELRHLYIDATPSIQNEVGEAIRYLPTVLIDTDTGRLHDKTHQAAAFEELPIFDELRSSMTTTLDCSRIREKVTEFYRYVMFSHKWQLGEPTFQQVENGSVYSLPSSPTFDKLRNFCKLVVALQYKWAWSDTCCVNQLDKGVQQESIVAMFRWYRRSSLTVVHLLGVLSEWQEAGCLWKSIWNTRGWTYQEYVASEVIQFYTEDWKPYFNLQIFNHKESHTVLSEMERATNVATRELIILQPGLDRAREKLYLASGRQTTREEDMAYSLFGIFGISLPVVYGEGNLAIGRLLEHILTRSDEVALLAWTGHSGSHYSYLPASLTVYNEIVPPHVPIPVETPTMDRIVSSLRSSIPDITLVIDLYERLDDLPPLSLLAGRLRLPGIVFKLGDLSPSGSDAESNAYVYHTTTPLLGDVAIKTTADLSEMRGLRLIHPWISPLIDQDFLFDDALFDLPTRALRLLVRLWQPFGGLLLASTGRSQYRRVATDSLIVVRLREEAPLSEVTDAVCTVNVQ